MSKPRGVPAPGDQRLRPNILVLSWISFFQDVASEMLYPVMPIFLTSVLGAPPVVVGLTEGLADAVSAILKGVSGVLSDRTKRRPLIASGYGLSTVAKGLIAFAPAWPFVMFCRILDRTGKGLRTSPRDALIAVETPISARGKAFGLHRGFDTAGAVIGPLLGLAVYRLLHGSIRPMFLIAMLPASLSLVMVTRIRESATREPQPVASPFGRPPLPAGYWGPVLFLFLAALISLSNALLVLRLQRLGMSLVQIMLAYTLYNVCYAVLSYPAGRLSDRHSRHLVYRIGLVALAVSYLGFGSPLPLHSAWPFLATYGAYSAITDGVGKAWISDLLPARSVGRGLGILHAGSGIASLLAGLWAGLAWGATGRLPFLISGVAAALLAAAMGKLVPIYSAPSASHVS